MTSRKQEIKSLIAAELRVPVESLDEEMTLEAVGFDSLQAAEAILAIEKAFDHQIDAPQIAGALTPDTRLGDLVNMIDGAVEGMPKDENANS